AWKNAFLPTFTSSPTLELTSVQARFSGTTRSPGIVCPVSVPLHSAVGTAHCPRCSFQPVLPDDVNGCSLPEQSRSPPPVLSWTNLSDGPLLSFTRRSPPWTLLPRTTSSTSVKLSATFTPWPCSTVFAAQSTACVSPNRMSRALR